MCQFPGLFPPFQCLWEWERSQPASARKRDCTDLAFFTQVSIWMWPKNVSISLLLLCLQRVQGLHLSLGSLHCWCCLGFIASLNCVLLDQGYLLDCLGVTRGFYHQRCVQDYDLAKRTGKAQSSWQEVWAASFLSRYVGANLTLLLPVWKWETGFEHKGQFLHQTHSNKYMQRGSDFGNISWIHLVELVQNLDFRSV